MDGQATKWRRNIAENFNRLSRVHDGSNVTDGRRHERRTGDSIYRTWMSVYVR